MSTVKKKTCSSDNSEEKLEKLYLMSGLKQSMHDPKFVIESDELVVIIKDKYPKSKKHFLVLPWEDVDTIRDLRKKHLSLLKHMHDKAIKFSLRSENSETYFRFGYHVIPSMRQLHLHVISQDFDSPHLKTAWHFNSFTTDYFIESKEVIKQIEENGKVKVMDMYAAFTLLDKPLRCHICKNGMKTLPRLKAHIRQHASNGYGIF